jgi:hypothetical protein
MARLSEQPISITLTGAQWCQILALLGFARSYALGYATKTQLAAIEMKIDRTVNSFRDMTGRTAVVIPFPAPGTQP